MDDVPLTYDRPDFSNKVTLHRSSTGLWKVCSSGKCNESLNPSDRVVNDCVEKLNQDKKSTNVLEPDNLKLTCNKLSGNKSYKPRATYTKLGKLSLRDSNSNCDLDSKPTSSNVQHNSTKDNSITQDVKVDDSSYRTSNGVSLMVSSPKSDKFITYPKEPEGNGPVELVAYDNHCSVSSEHKDSSVKHKYPTRLKLGGRI